MSDASCTPSDITYPTDLNLLNEAREKTEKIIKKLRHPVKGKILKRPRPDIRKARKEYLKIAKKKKVSRKERRKAIKKQLILRVLHKNKLLIKVNKIRLTYNYKKSCA